MLEAMVQTCRTPRGVLAAFECRRGTVDWDVIESTLTGDEYGLAALTLSVWAFGIGAYIGSVAVALALDTPDLRVIAIEPIPENVRLCRANVRRNGLAERAQIINGAIGPPDGASLLRNLVLVTRLPRVHGRPAPI